MFRDALEHPSELVKPLQIRPAELRELPRAVAKMAEGTGTSGNGLSIGELQEKIVGLFRAGSLSEISRRDLRQSPKGFFGGPTPLSEQEGVQAAVMAIIAERRQKSAVLAAVLAYLEQFDPSNEQVRKLGVWLDSVIDWWPWAWSERAKTFRLFNPDEGPQRLAAAILGAEVTPSVILEKAGLDGALSTSLFGEMAFAAACSTVQRSPKKALEGHQGRLVDWGNRGSKFSFSKVFALYAAALIEPWGDKEPPEDHQQLIMGELELFAGDPRVRPALWSVVKERAPVAYETLLRWLTKASVYQFFDIVDLTAEPHMWRYRRAFWTAFLEAGHIEAAWVVFGENGARLARRAASASGERGLMSFGQLERSASRSSDHAALIMQIGDLAVAEWSHNGKYNIWRKSDKNRPAMFRPRYAAHELMYAPIAGSHSGNETFSWQNTVAGIIRQETGRATKSAWLPGRTKPR